MKSRQRDTVAKQEETLFSLQFSIVIVEHIRLISRALRKRHGVTLNEYCILLLLDFLGQKTSSTVLGQYLIFKQGTLLAILASLEESEYIRKYVHPTDGRAMLVCLTDQGHSKAKRLAQEVGDLMKNTFWRSFPSREYLAPLGELKAQLDRLRGYAMDEVAITKSTKELIHALLFRVISLVVDTWTRAIRAHSSLAFNEGRILLLLELYGHLAPSDIARRLHLERSSISCGLKHLSSLELIDAIQDPDDGRGRLYRCSTKGFALSHELFSALRKATYDAYETYSDDAVIALNAQHMRMYSDMHAVAYYIEDVLSS